MTTVALTTEQIRQNIMEDAQEYQDEWIEELTNDLRAAYSQMFMHAAMIAHWATLFHKPVSTMLTNFSNTPSIAIPTVRNLDPPPIFPTASGSGLAVEEPELAYPAEDDNWEVQSIDETPMLPVPLPHVNMAPASAPPIHNLRPNRKPITPTDPVPSMPASLLQFLQVNPLEAWTHLQISHKL